MPSFFFRGILLPALLPFSSLASWEITRQEGEDIGKQIFMNECSGKQEKLVWWNDGEHFASLGIGHFIWYPEGEKGPFEETFPALLTFLDAHDVTLPDGLKTSKSCPWSSKQKFLEKEQGTKKKELQMFLSRTISWQAAFIAKRFEQTLTKLFSDLDEDHQKPHLRKVEQIGRSSQGKYALLDYLNFKGEGMSLSERYQGEGWGLRQVLEEMPENTTNPLADFAETAKAILKRRVHNSPPERHEERWLSGWLHRIDSYNLKNSANASRHQ
jgi:hypothetical protein